MNMTPSVDLGLPTSKRFPMLGTPMGWVLSLLLAALGAYLLAYHTTHVLLVLPYTLLLSCPLMHLFGHGGHGHTHPASDTSRIGHPAAPARPDEAQVGDKI